MKIKTLNNLKNIIIKMKLKKILKKFSKVLRVRCNNNNQRKR